MSTFKKSTIMIAGVPRQVVLINYKPDPKSDAMTVDTMHHIHVLDRSGSMSSSIVSLMEDVKKTFRAIPVGDYISVVWFSSEGQNGVVIKGYKKTEDDDLSGIDNLIDSIKSTVGCTCFYQPMDLVKSIVEEMKPMCPYYNITLFTDGCSCCNVSATEDYTRTLYKVYTLKHDIMALNTIGYSNYYDEKFLTDAASISEFGKYSHSSRIEDYSEIFSHNYERVKDMVVDKVEISAGWCDILYLNSKSSRLRKDSITLSSIDKRKNQFLVILPEFTKTQNVSIHISVNDEIIDIASIKESKLLPATTLNLQYALAYEYYYKGDRETCLNILSRDLRDKYLINEHLKAFTLDETSKFLKKLNLCIYKNLNRNYLSAPENYVPADDAFCVMDLLNILSSDEGNQYMPNISAYKRVGLKVEDTFDLFTPDREAHVLSPFSDNLVYNKDRLNVSIKFTRPGTVSINPKSAKKAGLPETVESYQFQTHTIIKDGQLHLPSIGVKLSYDTLKTLENIQRGLYCTFMHHTETPYEYVLDLNALPLINRTYINDATLDKVYGAVVASTKLEIEQKVLKWKLAQFPDTIPNYSPDKIQYTYEQVKVLEEHGINEFGAYVGVNRKVTEKNEDDYYEARELEFTLKGCSSIPAIEKALESYNNAIAKNKTPTFMSEAIHSAMNDINYEISSMSIEEKRAYLGDRLHAAKTNLMSVRNKLSAVKIAKVLTGSWWEGLETTKDGWSYKIPNLDYELIIKANHKKVFFN